MITTIKPSVVLFLTYEVFRNFEHDANGILNVHVKDKAPAKKQKIRIEGSGLSTGILKK